MPRIEAGWYVIEEAHIDGIVIWQNELGQVYQTSPSGLPKNCEQSTRIHQIIVRFANVREQNAQPVPARAVLKDILPR